MGYLNASMTNSYYNEHIYDEAPDRTAKLKDNDNKTSNQMTLVMDIDGTKIKDDIERRVRSEVVELTKKEIHRSIFRPTYSTGYSYENAPLQEWIREFVKQIIVDEKENIIKEAAHELADSMRRSKPVRERFCDILEEELK